MHVRDDTGRGGGDPTLRIRVIGPKWLDGQSEQEPTLKVIPQPRITFFLESARHKLSGNYLS
jgi:hypothetical protein